MFKKFIILTSCLLVNSTSALFSQNYPIMMFPQNNSPRPQVAIYCAPELKSCLNKIQKIEKAQKMLEEIQREGPIRIVINDHFLSEQFGAYWDMENRVVCINLATRKSEGEIIGSIVFELHNALAQSELKRLEYLAATRQISRENYIESMERLEYENSLKASFITELGIQLGIFPPSARLNVYSDFQEHYYYQKIGGHSAWIGQTYDDLVRGPHM